MLGTAQLPSDRKFGWFFVAVFALGGGYAFWQSHNIAWTISLFAVALAFLILAIAAPNLLAPLNKLWVQLGLLLGRIVSPIVLGLIFFVLITPVALVTRLGGRDALRLKKQNSASYWVDRDPIGPPPDSFKNQF
jgi:hypothetical protein